VPSTDDQQLVPRFEAAAWRVATRTIFLILGLVLVIWLAFRLQPVLVQVLLAIIISAGMTPIVDRLSEPSAIGARWRPPRGLVVLALYLLLLALLAALFAVLLPPLLHDLEDLVRRSPGLLTDLQQGLQEWVDRSALLPQTDVRENLSNQLRQAAGQLVGLLSQALGVVRLALGVVSGTLDAILTLVVALYITADSRRIRGYLIAFLPVDRQAQGARVASRIGQRLGGWVRGQLLLSSIIGLVTLVGLSLLGVRYAVLLALIAAIGEAVPMIGPIISAVPAVIVALTQSPTQGLLTLGLYVLIQQLENHLIVPRVLSRAVELHPLAVMLALLAGSQLMGIAGAILSVPVSAAVSVIVDELRRERLEQPATPTSATS
jgi:predicted PurR-regulated permease PerM